MLKERLVREPEAGFEALVHDYQHRLFAFALAYTGDRSDAEEVAQDALLRAHRAFQRYGSDRIRQLALSAWLHRITLNLARNRVRDRARTAAADLDAEPRADAALEPAAQVESRERLEWLAGLVARLKPHQRDAVVLRCVQGLPYAEAAGVLGRPEVTVRSDVHRGLSALRKLAGDVYEVDRR